MKSLLNTPLDTTTDTELHVNGRLIPAHLGERLVDALNRDAKESEAKQVPQVCYLPTMGPIQSLC